MASAWPVSRLPQVLPITASTARLAATGIRSWAPWNPSTLAQSITGESSTMPRISAECVERVAVCSTIAPPIDQPISTMSVAPCAIANSIAASTSRHSTSPREYLRSSLPGASSSLR